MSAAEWIVRLSIGLVYISAVAVLIVAVWGVRRRG